MPTGYTACVEDGTVTEFPEFALRCARAFGPLIEMRDEPLDAPIPENLSSRHADRLTEETRRLLQLQTMNAADIAAAYEDHFLKEMQRYEQRLKERAEQNARYDAMLAKVHAWTPPTSEHTGLKGFMIQQIKISRDNWEIEMPERADPQVWHKEQVAACKWSVSNAIEEARKESERGGSRNEWVRQLRESLLS